MRSDYDGSLGVGSHKGMFRRKGLEEIEDAKISLLLIAMGF